MMTFEFHNEREHMVLSFDYDRPYSTAAGISLQFNPMITVHTPYRTFPGVQGWTICRWRDPDL